MRNAKIVFSSLLVCIGVLLLSGVQAQAQEDEWTWTLVFEGQQADYSYVRESVEIMPGGVRATIRTQPHDPGDFQGFRILNSIVLFNKKRQMKTLISVGYKQGGGPVELAPEPGWRQLKPGSPYDALWKAVMRDAGLL